jgi:hypothetical protein
MPRIINQQLTKSVCYYFSNPTVYHQGQQGTGEIIMGLPEAYAAPPGFEKIVCQTAMDAERWSSRMRVWDEAKEKIALMYQRQQEEKQYQDICREMTSKITSASNQVNRDFAIQAYENFKKHYEDRMQGMERTSFLHSEAYSADDKRVATPKMRLPTKQHYRDIADFEE